MKKELDGARKNYDKEKMKNADLQNQLAGLDQDMKFKLQLLETELIEERKKNKIDFNAIDRKMKSDYETRCSKGNSILFVFKILFPRLSAEMESLRRVYEEQTEKAKSEYMNLHSQKVQVDILSFSFPKMKMIIRMMIAFKNARRVDSGEDKWPGQQGRA